MKRSIYADIYAMSLACSDFLLCVELSAEILTLCEIVRFVYLFLSTYLNLVIFWGS